jgi:iron complex outermembrane receptor protein
VTDISNAAAATIRGVELENQTQLPSAWRVGGHLAWLDARYERYAALSAAGTTIDAAGHWLANAPEWSGYAWVERKVPIGGRAAVSARTSARWQTAVYYSPENDAVQRQGSYGVVDANATLQLARRTWSIGLFGHNLLNTDYITGAFSGPLPAFGGQPGEPRQLGLQLDVHFAASH